MVPGNLGHREQDKEDGGLLLSWDTSLDSWAVWDSELWEVEMHLYSKQGPKKAGWETGVILGQFFLQASQSRSQGPAPGPGGQVPGESGWTW